MCGMSAPTYMSLFSACGGMDLGLDAAGWRCIGQAEVEPWRRDVLERHWPGIKRYDDVRAVVADGDTLPEQPDLIAGGFPCQDLSVAGKRKGLAGERSGLAWEFMRIIRAVQPRCVLIENVPGLLSSNQGRDMAALIGTLAELGDGLQYGVAYRILDSQWFGVPQRRRRVFIVGIRADGDPATAAGRAAQVLAIGTRCEGRHPSSGKAWPSNAASAAGSTGSSSSAGAGGTGRVVPTLGSQSPSHGQGTGDQFVLPDEQEAAAGRVVGSLSAQGYVRMTDQELVRAGQLVTPDDEDARAAVFDPQHGTFSDVTPTLVSGGTGGVPQGPMVNETSPEVRVFQMQAIGQYKEDDLASTMAARQYKMFTDIVAFPINAGVIGRKDGNGNASIDEGGDPAYTVHHKDAQAIASAHTAGWNPQPGDVTPTLKANGSMPSVSSVRTGLRRLTPVECERLQGWPDDHTRWDAIGNEASDAKRYSATGDGVTANVAEWIGNRIREALL
jgi:DNA (cytosine-5)-methyltransferase 1